MPLTPGSRLAEYEILSQIGAGGMGEVYRARDTRLHRDVAIKVLPAAFAQDPERLARFRREAYVLASLNHPHIAAIYGFEESEGGVALAMELVEGEDLAERLARSGAIPVDETIGIARQIAEGLEAAHEKGIVHRDLKPANIRITGDGTVKLLDFGLARAYEGDGSASGTSVAVAQSPTMTRHVTEGGLILGTAAYMAPEQARGTSVDKRADIWSFGVVLCEVLTGRRLFDGGTVSDVLAAVLRQDVDLEALPAETPDGLRNLIARCLERDPKLRLRDIGEARVLLAGPLEAPHRPARMPAGRQAVVWRALPWLLVAAALVILAIARTPAPVASHGPGTMRFTITGPTPAPGAWFTIDPHDPPVVSPDGRMLALPLEAPEGKALYLRPFEQFELIRVEGGGRRPFFSPDGRSIAFARVGSIWRMNLGERQPSLVGQLNEVLWDIGFSAWHPDGRLLVPGLTGLWSLPASGGAATLLVASDPARLERFVAVSVLPDGRLLLNVETGSSMRIDILSRTATERRVAASGLERGRVVGDVLISRSSGQWRAARLDLDRLETGPSIPLSDLPETMEKENPLGRSFAWTDASSLVRELVWVSRSGVASPVGLAQAYIRWPRVSPDGTRIALGMHSGDVLRPALRREIPIRVFDLRTRARSELDGFSEPVWTADGRAVISSLGTPPSGGLGEQVADGSRHIEKLFELERGDAWPTSVSRDGSVLVYYGALRDSAEGTHDLGDIFVLDRLTQERRQLALPGAQRGGRLSPDGRWLAFESLANSRSEVHVRPFPDLDADFMVSPDGGDEPAWSPDGRELYYRRGPDLMVVKVPAAGQSGWPAPDVLFTGTFARDTFGDQSYDVAPDGRFLMMRPTAAGPIQVQVVLDWLGEVHSRLAHAN